MKPKTKKVATKPSARKTGTKKKPKSSSKKQANTVEEDQEENQSSENEDVGNANALDVPAEKGQAPETGKSHGAKGGSTAYIHTGHQQLQPQSGRRGSIEGYHHSPYKRGSIDSIDEHPHPDGHRRGGGLDLQEGHPAAHYHFGSRGSTDSSGSNSFNERRGSLSSSDGHNVHSLHGRSQDSSDGRHNYQHRGQHGQRREGMGYFDQLNHKRFSIDSTTSNESLVFEEQDGQGSGSDDDEKHAEFNNALQTYMKNRLPKRRMSTECQHVMLACYQEKLRGKIAEEHPDWVDELPVTANPDNLSPGVVPEPRACPEGLLAEAGALIDSLKVEKGEEVTIPRNVLSVLHKDGDERKSANMAAKFNRWSRRGSLCQ